MEEEEEAVAELHALPLSHKRALRGSVLTDAPRRRAATAARFASVTIAMHAPFRAKTPCAFPL